MQCYVPPLKDIRFALNDVLDAPGAIAALPVYGEVDAGLIQQVIEEAGRFAAGVLLPLNASGDHEGCRFEDGKVTTPKGFAEAWRQFAEAGWPGLVCEPEHGGQGLPHLLNCVLYEMLSAANHAWTMYPGLLHGAYACLRAHASEELKARYLPKIASGEWLATMNLTEPSAGSDLGLLRTRAEPANDGSVRITGTKIFISGGEQDFTDNIVHLVLARLPDAPAGSKGISLFLVPKILPDGTRNALHCSGIEHKMGLRGSATCTMQFEGATGWLVGEPHRGLAAMFVMMNAARLNTGVQAIGIAVQARTRTLIEDISLDVRPSEFVAIIGPNGAGKSTLLSALAGDRKLGAGEVLLDGRPLGQWSRQALARRRAVLPQHSTVAFDFTGLQIAMLGLLALRGRLSEPEMRGLAEAALAETEALTFADRPYTVLSGGERQRIQLARVLAQCDAEPQERPFLLLDEPISGLDLAHQHAALAGARRRADRGLGVVAVLHDLSMAARYADRVGIVEKGRLTAFGPADETLEPERLSAVFATPIVRMQAGNHTAFLSSG